MALHNPTGRMCTKDADGPLGQKKRSLEGMVHAHQYPGMIMSTGAFNILVFGTLTLFGETAPSTCGSIPFRET